MADIDWTLRVLSDTWSGNTYPTCPEPSCIGLSRASRGRATDHCLFCEALYRCYLRKIEMPCRSLAVRVGLRSRSAYSAKLSESVRARQVQSQRSAEQGTTLQSSNVALPLQVVAPRCLVQTCWRLRPGCPLLQRLRLCLHAAMKVLCSNRQQRPGEGELWLWWAPGAGHRSTALPSTHGPASPVPGPREGLHPREETPRPNEQVAPVRPVPLAVVR